MYKIAALMFMISLAIFAWWAASYCYNKTEYSKPR
jgi:hypothetical protein